MILHPYTHVAPIHVFSHVLGTYVRIQVLEADRLLYLAEFGADDMPEVHVDNGAKLCMAAVDTVWAKLWDACREAERRDEYQKLAREMLENVRVARRDAFVRAEGGEGKDADKLDRLWQAQERRHFPMPGTFVITHYADDVEYQAEGMIEKNIDKCHVFLRSLARAGGAGPGGGQGGVREPLCLLLLRRGLGLSDDGREVEDGGGGGGKRGKLRTVAGVFKEQLLAADGDGGWAEGARGLIPTLESTHMHFVRCLKPNDAQRALLFDRSKVAGQLSSNGVVGAVKLAQAGGLPTRYSYQDLWDRHGMDLGVVLQALWRRQARARRQEVGSLSPREGVEALLQGLGEHEWTVGGRVLSRPAEWQPLRAGAGSYKLGRSMVFLAAGRIGLLQALRAVEIAPFAARLQAGVRRVLNVARYRSMCSAVRHIRICVYIHTDTAHMCIYTYRYRSMCSAVRHVRAATRIQRWRRRWVQGQRRMRAEEAAARARRQAARAAAAEAERERVAREEEVRRRAQAEAQAAAERLRVEEERRREEEARAAEVRRRAREEEERRNRWVTDGLLRAGVIEQVGDGCSRGGSRTRGDGCCVQGVVHD